jgi:hypothetical protein
MSMIMVDMQVDARVAKRAAAAIAGNFFFGHFNGLEHAAL